MVPIPVQSKVEQTHSAMSLLLNKVIKPKQNAQSSYVRMVKNQIVAGVLGKTRIQSTTTLVVSSLFFL